MPIILDDNIINVINGPTMGFFLEQKNTPPQINNNYLVFFGDTHTTENFTRCGSDPKCLELQTDLIKMLNIFATTTRIDFYLERMDFFEKNTNRDMILDAAKKTQYGYSYLHDTSLRQLNDTEYANKIKEHKANDPTGKRNPFLGIGRSNMLDMYHLYYSCFQQKYVKDNLCLYKNINWQFADARKQLGKQYYVNRISHYIDFFCEFLIKYFDDENKIILDKIILYQMVEYYNEISCKINEFLSDIMLILTDVDSYIRKLISLPIYQKQFNKMNEESRNIFNHQSFVELAEKYISYFFGDVNFDKLIRIIKLLIEYFDLCPKETCNNERADNIIAELNSISCPNNVLIKYGYLGMCVGNCAMDIYFILRINKQDKEQEVNNKIVFSYFGGVHSQIVSYYFTDIVQTHIINASVISPPDIRRLEISSVDINLNTIMEHEPIDFIPTPTIGGKTKKRIRKYTKLQKYKRSGANSRYRRISNKIMKLKVTRKK